MISTLKMILGKNRMDKDENGIKILILDNCPEDLNRLQEEFASIPHNFNLITIRICGKISEAAHQIELEKPDLVVIDPSISSDVLYQPILTFIRCRFKDLNIISFSRADLNGHSEKFGIQAVVHKSDGFIALIQAINNFLRNKQLGNANA